MHVLRLSDSQAGRVAQAVRTNKAVLICEACVDERFCETCTTCAIQLRTALEVLIESHVPLVCKLVSKYQVDADKREELTSVGLATLVAALNDLEHLDDVSRIGAYVRRVVGWALHRAISYDGTITVPADAAPEERLVNRMVDALECQVEDNRPEGIKEVELNEVLDKIIDNDREMKVLHMLVDGHEPAEIAEELGVTTARVSQIKSAIAAKLDAHRNEWMS
jgi:RNA polymerase sigma factor (sigma-70 family)